MVSISLGKTFNRNLHRIKTRSIAPMLTITLSHDGYVRLTPECFVQVRLVHLHSGVDEDRPLASAEGATLSSITGYTEWVSATQPAITVGWDWQMTARDGQIWFIPVGYPRSNLMFVDKHGNDRGPRATEALLRSWIKSFEWQPFVYMTLHP